MNLDPILAETLDATTKGYPLSAAPLPISAIGAQRWSLLAGDLPLPLAVIRDSALAHNHAWMRDFTASTGVLLAPHGKTTMAPQIFAQQLAAGAWGMTVANVQQLGICVRFGVRRVIMANQLLGAPRCGAVIRLQEAHPDLEFHFLIDSLAQLASIEECRRDRSRCRASSPRWSSWAFRAAAPARGRSTRRSAVARAVAASKTVALSGLECYEGLQITGDSAPRRDHGRRADAARARCRARLRPRRTVRRSVDHPHRGRLGRVRHRRARSADEAVEACAHDPAQRLLRHARFGHLQPHAGGREGAQRRRLAIAARACSRRSKSGRECNRARSRGWRS